MRKKADNKIKIPWYRRNVGIENQDLEGVPPLSLPPILPIVPKPNPNPVRQPVRQPSTQPATEPSRQPVRAPFAQPEPQPNPFPNPWGLPNPYPLPKPFPIPERQPQREPQGQPAPQLPAFPLVPAWVNNPNYDWAKHFQDIANNLPEQPSPQPVQQTEKVNPVVEAVGNILKPIVWLFVANEVKNQWIEVNITDPIYNEMLKDPVLGLALREAEKSNYDMEALGTYFANYDWDNFDAEQMTKELTAIIGAAGAARIIIFFIGRKVVFKV
jgi:hypothetical protein